MSCSSEYLNTKFTCDQSNLWPYALHENHARSAQPRVAKIYCVRPCWHHTSGTGPTPMYMPSGVDPLHGLWVICRINEPF